jgi:hypothetical protein
MPVIQRISIVTLEGVKSFEVGNVYVGQAVIEIKNNSLEFENSIHSQYDVLDKNGNLIASIENCPVVVEYRSVAEEVNQ